MASLSFTMATSIPSFSPFIRKTASHQQQRFKTHNNNQTHRFKISCNVTSNDDDDHHNHEQPQNLIQSSSLDMHNVDRRNLLLAGAGLYTSVNMTNLPSAIAVPIKAPNDISNCRDANSGFPDPNNTVRTKACCPSLSENHVKDFVFPTTETIRTRPALHTLDPNGDYVRKFKAAIKAMKNLREDHPHSFKQQAKIHCAYCNGSYTQIDSGFPDKELQVHNSWLFFPFHRWYLYFFERIMGKLIDDPTFALPYWSWDNPAGMEIPAIFEDGELVNPLFDSYRNCKHLPPAIVDLEYDGVDAERGFRQKQIDDNLWTMHRQMIRNAPNTMTFFGGRYSAGMNPVEVDDQSVGSIEAGCHTAIHRWVGDSRMPNDEDMGNFYSAGYDPLFYVHHANVDRMWTIWKGLRPWHNEPTDRDWLDASFVFYDENEQLVRVYNRDCVKIENLKYNYEVAGIDIVPWAKSKPTPRFKKSRNVVRSTGKVKKVEEQKFPVKLDDTVKVLVTRPKTNRSKEEKEVAAEMLFLKGINFDGEKFVKFDVFVNDASEYDVSMISVANSEFVGSFAQLPHNQSSNLMSMKSGASFGLTEVLEDIEAEDDEYVLVTIVPRAGCEDVTISEIKIKLIDLV